MDTIKCDAIISTELRRANQVIGDHFDSDVVFLKSPMRQPIDDAVRNEIEEISAGSKRNSGKLTVVLETTGGYIETVERIVSVFRRHYTTVDFIVPNYAYSAGTILVLSGDAIYMDYYSVLGPIDPQLGGDNGSSVPGMGYLAKFQELVNTINMSPDPNATKAELAYLVKKFDPAMLFIIEQAVEHSKVLIKEWLPQYKFKNWNTHSSTGKAVTPEDREQRADQIATILGDASRWHSHGRGVGIKELSGPELKLIIDNYGDNDVLNKAIAHYYGLVIDYMKKCGFVNALHSNRGIRRL